MEQLDMTDDVKSFGIIKWLSLRYACIRSSDIILIFWLLMCQISFFFTASIAEPAHEKKSRSLLNHSRSLFDASGTEALALRKALRKALRNDSILACRLVLIEWMHRLVTTMV